MDGLPIIQSTIQGHTSASVTEPDFRLMTDEEIAALSPDDVASLLGGSASDIDPAAIDDGTEAATLEELFDEPGVILFESSFDYEA